MPFVTFAFGTLLLGLVAVVMLYLLFWSDRGLSSGPSTDEDYSAEPTTCSICEENKTTTRVNKDPVCSECKQEYYVVDE